MKKFVLHAHNIYYFQFVKIIVLIRIKDKGIKGDESDKRWKVKSDER